jgi:hypothetical protein
MVVSAIVGLEIIDRSNGRSRRTLSQLVAELVERGGASFSGHLDGPVGPIANPARQSQLSRRLADEPAKSNTLHATTHQNVQSHSRPSTAARISAPAMGS